MLHRVWFTLFAIGFAGAAWPLLTPVFRILMPGVPAGHPAVGAVTLNLSANMLDLDNAATPLGLKAMRELQTLNPTPEPYLVAMLVAVGVLRTSGARAMMLETMQSQGVDSFAARLAAVIQGSTETTFYVLAVYFGSVGIRHARQALWCGLFADAAGVVAAIFVCYAFFG